MSTIKHADKILSCFADKKIGIAQDMIISTTFQEWWANSVGSVYRVNSLHQVVWLRQLFTEPYPYGGYGYARQCQLSHDGQFLYVVGLGPDLDDFGIPHFYKLNAATGKTEWERETDYRSLFLCVDHNGDIIIWRDVAGDLLKYDSDGNPVWPSPIQYSNVKGIAVDSDNNIYLAHSPNVGGYSLQKLNSSGVALSVGYTIPNPYTAGTGAMAVKIDKNDNIFIGSAASEQPDGFFHALFKLDTSCNFVASAPVGPDDGNVHSCRHVVIDSLDNVFALGSWGYLYKYSGALVEQWVVRDGTDGREFARIVCDVQNRIHQIHVLYDYDKIRDKDGNFARSAAMLDLPIEGSIIFAREVYVGHYTDQPTILFREDMTPFMDDTIPEFVLSDYTRAEGDLVWGDDIWFASRPEPTTGIFENLHAGEGLREPGFGTAWKQVGWVPSADPANSNWDAYPGFGGIGNCPLIYTVTFYGMKNISDDSPSEHNGEHLIIRGPGYYGFFFGVDHNAGTRINFTVHEESSSDDREKLYFGTDEYPSSIFKYETVSNNNEKLTHVLNENDKGPPPTTDATVYEGHASMYPGKIARWDATTIWVSDDIVAWEGWFYKALNQNSGSEPPSGDWTQL